MVLHLLIEEVAFSLAVQTQRRSVAHQRRTVAAAQERIHSINNLPDLFAGSHRRMSKRREDVLLTDGPDRDSLFRQNRGDGAREQDTVDLVVGGDRLQGGGLEAEAITQPAY